MTVRESSEAVHTVEFRNISKYFPGVKALDNVSFSATSHFVYAIVGENGAGKSTLLKILNGDYSMDSGEILFDGVPQRFSSPRDAIDAGVSIIYQEPQLVPEMTVAENIFLGSWPVTDSKLVDFPKMVRDTQEVIDEFGLDIDPRVKVRNLSVAHQQMVEIMKAYARRAKIIAFDEPTSSLTDREIDVLFSIIGKLKAQGKIIFYVSHRMNEIEKIADKSVVLKDGQLVKVVNQNEVTIRELVSLMVGRDLGDVFNSLDRNTKLGEVVLEVEGLSNRFKPLTLDIMQQ
jgi:ABC-type sugar transport system ATPase subunit